MQQIDRNHLIEGVDTDIPLDKLIPVTERQRLLEILTQLLGCPLRIVSPLGELLGGNFEGDARVSLSLRLDFEEVARLEIEQQVACLPAVVRLIEWWLSKQMKFLMASSLHHAIVEGDYQQLQQRNRALEASELRYKTLAEQLDLKVQAQLKVIKAAERRLYEKEKLASVGQLAAGMAHEINNPIGFVTSNLRMAGRYVEQFKNYIDLLESQVPSAQRSLGHKELPFVVQDFTELLQESLDGCDRVAAIVKNLKDFSNVDGVEGAMGSVNSLIRNVYDLHKGKIPPGVEVNLRLCEVPDLMLYAGHLTQVFSNLLTNALEAVGDLSSNARISFSVTQLADQVVIKVADNGRGMDPQAQHHAFEPFYTTRAVGQGTGLGLTVCRDIVLAHRGSITLSSQLGRGTVVVIKLPVAALP